MNFNFLKRVFRAVMGEGLNKNPVAAMEQRVANTLALYKTLHKEHREFQGEKFQNSARENLIPLMVLPNFMVLMSDMKHAFADYSELIGIDQVRDLVNSKLPRETLDCLMRLSADYRLAHELLGDEADIETKTFMQAYKKTKEVYGPEVAFAAFVATAAVIDVIQAQYELGADVGLGPDSEDKRHQRPSGPKF